MPSGPSSICTVLASLPLAADARRIARRTAAVDGALAPSLGEGEPIEEEVEEEEEKVEDDDGDAAAGAVGNGTEA